jgi:hypothetical protein
VEGEEAPDDDDEWLDQIALSAFKVPRYFAKVTQYYKRQKTTESVYTPQVLMARQAQEKQLAEIVRFLRTLIMPKFDSAQKQRRFISKATQYYEREGRIWKRNGQKAPQLVIIDGDSRLAILTQGHENLGHRGVDAMWASLRARFHWPHLRADIQHHVASCPQCQVRSTKKMEIPPTVSAPTTIFSKIYIDVMRMPVANKFSMIVAARDDLTGFCEAKALTSQTAEALANFFWTHIYCRYGCPIHVTTDNGSEVEGAFKLLMARLRIPQIQISPYNKHANGVVERGHFTMREALVKACGGKISQWPTLLPAAVFADRVTVSSVTGYSPFELLHATQPILPFDLAEATFLVEGFYSGMSTAELLAMRIRQLKMHPQDIEHAATTLKKARFASKAQFEKRFKRRLLKEDYQPGELILLRNMKIETNFSSTHKTDDRYTGPFEVCRKNRGGAYVLQELDGTQFRNGPVAAFRLIPYITRNHWFMRTGWMGDEDADETDTDSSGKSSGSESSMDSD